MFDQVENDFKFMILEVTKQLKDTLNFISSRDEGLFDKISSRDDYIDILKSRIEENCFASVHTHATRETAKQTIDRARAINIIGGNLERMGDYAVNIVDQMQYLENGPLLDSFDTKKVFKNLIESLSLIEKALFKRNLTLAMQICQSEHFLDRRYAATLQRIIREIRAGENVENRITILFIFSYLERMGDALLNIGEAIIFATLGQKLKIHQYRALEESLSKSDLPASIGDINFESIWGTRSGCRIGHIQDRRDNGSVKPVIFKKGSHKKLADEKANIERWEQILPGLPPKILNYQEDGRHSTILIEYLGDNTFQHIMLTGSESMFKESFLKLQTSLRRIWSSTIQATTIHAGYYRQLSSRINDVLSVHPSFSQPKKRICGVSVQSLPDRIDSLKTIDKELFAPFSVFVHGDFNIDNVIYQAETGDIRFIDLHRSGDNDFVQDISVFLVSNFRQPVFEIPIRTRINTVMKSFYHFAREYAHANGDTTFDARLALGTARSLMTSTRFELNPNFAQTMYLRSVYLLERLNDHKDRPWEDFVLPQDVLIY